MNCSVKYITLLVFFKKKKTYLRKKYVNGHLCKDIVSACKWNNTYTQQYFALN